MTQGLTQVQETEAPKGALLVNNAISSHLIELGYPLKSLESMLKCGVSTDFAIKQCDHAHKLFLISHNCNLRTCPRCAQIRKRRLVAKFFPFLNRLYQDNTNFLYHLTISPVNYDSLEEGLKDIRKNFNKFLRLRYRKAIINKKTKEIIKPAVFVKDILKGGLYVIESKNPNGSWNIHLHVLVYGRYIDNRIRGHCFDCGQNYMKLDEVSNKFYCANTKCNSSNVVFYDNSRLVNLWKQSSKKDVHMYVTRLSSTAKILNYLLKYVSANKDDFSSDYDIARYIVATRKMKLVSTFGCFYRACFEKPLALCPVCYSPIYFIFDKVVIREYLNKLDSSLPPPSQLFLFDVN